MLRSSLVAFLLAGGACADDVPGLTTTSDTDDTTTTGDPMVTTIDPDTTGGTTMGTDTGETTTGETETDPTAGETTEDPTTTDGGAVCGNGMVEDGEQCDVEDLGGETCESQGFGGGALGCADDCTFDTTNCTPGAECGNGVLEGKEQCDGDDLGGATCESQGFEGGTLGCADDCTLDTSECTAAPGCGNGVADPGEACDGDDLAGEDCVSQGFAGGGVLACADDCSTFDTAGCMGGGVCAHDPCVTGDVLDPTCDPCVAQICAADAFCCETEWDQLCVNQVSSVCGEMCPGPVCGNDLLEPGETCDGADLGGEDCTSQGFAGGVLACAADCTAFDTAACEGVAACFDADIGEATGPGVAVGSTVGADSDLQPTCGGSSGNDHVVEFTATVAGSYTFDTFGSTYDTKLALFSDCATQLSCNDDAGAGTQSQLVRDMAAGETILVVIDGFNGATGDYILNITPPPAPAVCGDAVVEAPEACDGANLNGQTCVTQGFAGGVLACAADCSAYDTAGCMGAPAFPCEDENIGNAIGANVATGTTAMGQDNDLNPSCGAGDANDRVIRFQAPAAAQYTFNTNGSTYDTVLAVFSDCATQLQCDDDSGTGTQSLLSRNLAAGETVLILIDGYNGASGNYILNITSP